MALLHKINRYLSATGLPETKFGRLALHDPRLVRDLRNGRCPRASTVARIEAYMAANRPEQAR